MIDAPVALALTAGVLAAFNPCGFAMLPAYISYFVGTDAAGEHAGSGVRTDRLLRAALVGGAVTAGFVAVFGTLGLLITEVQRASRTVSDWTPRATIVIGMLLAVLGGAMVAGMEPRLRLPKPGRARGGGSTWSMFLYGVSYAVVSLSCTIPAFLATVSTTFKHQSVLSGLAVYVAYATGMGLVLVAVSIAVALAQHAFVRGMRRVLPYVNRASGALLVLAGLYVAYYGWYEIRIRSDLGASAGPVDWVTSWSGHVTNWLDGLGTGWLVAALVALAGLLGAAAFVGAHRAPRHPSP